MNIKIDDITQDDIQKAINLEAVKLSSKTVRNIHGLISCRTTDIQTVYGAKYSLTKEETC